jgi:hypothetical protein
MRGMSYDFGGTLPLVALARVVKPSDQVRVPEVPRGTAVVVTRYREEVAKVAVVNPQDLAMLERSHELIEALHELAEPVEPTDAELAAAAAAEGPRPEQPIEAPAQIAAILRL